MKKRIILWLLCAMLFGYVPAARRSRQGKSSASVSWIMALLPVPRFSWTRSGKS